jgi:hypothetical protein
MRGRDGHGVDMLVDQALDVGEDGLPVEGAPGQALGREGRPHHEPELRIARGLPSRLDLAGDPFHVRRRHQAVKPVLPVDDEHLVDADVCGEKLVRGADRIL